jgi:hypothetical protein
MGAGRAATMPLDEIRGAYIQGMSWDPYIQGMSWDPYIQGMSWDPYIQGMSWDPYIQGILPLLQELIEPAPAERVRLSAG